MKTRYKISLQPPENNNKTNYFSIKLKDQFISEPVEFINSPKTLIISINDCSFLNFQKYLFKLNIIDKNDQWTLGEVHLVIIGNFFDASEDAIMCLWLIYGLEERAKRKGGYIHYILGRQDVLNIEGSWRFSHPKYATKPITSKTSPSAVFEGNINLYCWMQTKNLVERIGHFLFIQADLLAGIAQYDVQLPDIEQYEYSQHQIVCTASNNIKNNRIKSKINNDLIFFKRYCKENYGNNYLLKIITDKFVDGFHSVVSNDLIVPVKINAEIKDESLLIKKNNIFRVNSKNHKLWKS